MLVVRTSVDALHQRHGGDADDGLAGAAGQHDDAAAAADVAAGVEDVGRLALVVADVERQAGAARPSRRCDRQGGPFGVAGQVLGRVADGDQRLLEDAAEGRLDEEAGRVEPLAEVVAHLRLAGQFFEQRPRRRRRGAGRRLAVGSSTRSSLTRP